MFKSWKYARGSYLTIILTAIGGLSILGFAYHLRHFSEILSGVIGGLTIILGMVTAEWLSSSRKQIEDTRLRYASLLHNLERYLYSLDEFTLDPYSERNAIHWDQFITTYNSLYLLALSTRWPQPNAKKIREVANDLTFRFEALNQDAFENEYVWSMEERYELYSALFQFPPLIWARMSLQDDEVNPLIEVHRKTKSSQGLPPSWKKKSIS